jgi:hypothetical protein
MGAIAIRLWPAPKCSFYLRSARSFHLAERALDSWNSSVSNLLQQVCVALSAWLRQLVRQNEDKYRPECHYMRGPGPKARQKIASGREQ